MSNILPQDSTFNQGIGLQAEEGAECYRHLATVHVYGGVAFTNPSNDFFVNSHGVKTPEYWWKTIMTTDTATGATKAISWYIPNAGFLGSLDQYMLSIAELEARLGTGAVDIPRPPPSMPRSHQDLAQARRLRPQRDCAGGDVIRRIGAPA